MTTIALMEIGDVPESVTDSIGPAVERAFGARVTIAPPIRLPENAWDEERDQYRASVLVDALVGHKRGGWDRVLGIADVDLFAPGLNFVFGEADPRRGAAVVSVRRLRDGDPARLLRLATTEAVHELGHTFGLGHCDDEHCVMWFSNTLGETTRKGSAFCRTHRAELDATSGRARARL